MRQRKSAVGKQPFGLFKPPIKVESSNPFDKFPQDVLCEIFSYLDAMSLFRARLVCASFRKLIAKKDDPLFKRHVLRLITRNGQDAPSELPPYSSWKDLFLELKQSSFIRMCDGALVTKILEKRNTYCRELIHMISSTAKLSNVEGIQKVVEEERRFICKQRCLR
jgi:hypothetical protein